MNLLVKDKCFYKKMAVIAIPISLQSMITIGVNMTDTVMVGKLGETSLSATALANQFVNIYQICCMGIAMGASVLTSRFWGMQDITSLKKTITLMLRLCIVLAVLFMLPTILIPQLLMRMYTNDSAVIAQGVQYFKWMVYCYFLQGMTMTCTIVLRSVGQVNFPLFTSIGSFFVNILFNYMFIFGKLGVPRMEVEGAGVGTLIARVFEFSLICGYFLFVDHKIGYRLKDLRMKCNSLIKDYVSISIPVFVSDSLLALGTSAVAMVMGRIGTGFVSANSITVVTQQQAWTFLILGLVVGILGGGPIKVLSRPIIGLYNITPETAQIAGELMDAIAFIVIFQSMNSILTKGVLRGGDTKFLMVADIIFLWAASLPLGILAGLVWYLDAFWIYVFLKIDQICKSIWCVFRLRSGKWIKTFSKEKMNHAQ